jgi:hypothetical protein
MTDDFYNQTKKVKGLTNEILIDAVSDLVAGLHDGDYHGNVYKKRIEIQKGQGSQTAGRSLIAYKKDNNCYLIDFFKKSEKPSHTEKEKKVFRGEAEYLLALTPSEIKEWKKKTLLFVILEKKEESTNESK